MTITVAMVNTAQTHGGAARMASLLVNGLNQYAEDVHATLYHCENDFNDEVYIGLKKLTSRYINAGLARIGGSFVVYDFGVAEEIIDATENSDVLHVHNLHGYYLNFKKLLLSWCDRPIVWTWHDMWGATGRCGFSFNCDLWKKGCVSCPNKEYYPSAWLDNARLEFQYKSELFRRLKNLTIVCPSKWLADIAIERGFEVDEVKVIHNPVDSSNFSLINKTHARKILGLPMYKFTVLFLAADCGDERKGYTDFAKLPANEDWNYLAVGKPPLNPSPRILHVGRINDHSIISNYYAAADVMVLPSYADNYPNTVIESLLCGTPVIGYDEGGISSQLDYKYCSIVEKGRWQVIKEKLITIAQRGGKTSKVENDLHNYAKNNWSINCIVEQYENLYKSIIK